jgi:exosortase D (VPLPA-CTERM-specific)
VNERLSLLKHSYIKYFALLCLVILFFSYGYRNGIADMLDKWSSKEEYGYAYFIPFITAFLVWRRRGQLEASEFNPSWLGVIIALVAVILYFVGEIATTFTLVQYSLVFALVGTVFAFLGWPAFKIVAGPLLLLLFMVPLPQFIFNNLSGKLQLISSEIGVHIIRWFGISVYLEGNVIDLGDYRLQVVEACSGLRYLFPLGSLAFISVYLYRVEFWKRVVVFLSSIPITVLMNSFRIGVIGVLVNNWGQEQADGFLHYFEGWVIFMACLVILLIEMAVLARIGRTRAKLHEVFGLEADEPFQNGHVAEYRPFRPVHYGVFATAILVMVSSFYINTHYENIPDRHDFGTFPSVVGNWQGDRDTLDQIYLASLKLDDYLISDYRNKNGFKVNLYLAYYESQQAGSSAHSPRSCIPGGGWEIENISQIDVPRESGNAHRFKAVRMIIKKGDVRQLVYYWFQQRGRVITNEWLVKWFLFYDSLTKHRTDGALVRLTTSIGVDEDWSDGDMRLVNFAQEVVPILEDYVPN